MPGFDPHRPPELSIVEDCVHCGFCLDSCPTYVLWGQEADSPRGRIVLIDEALEGEGSGRRAGGGEALSQEMVTHFDRCLGCMACVTACPSGVRYDRLIQRVRPQVERHHARTGAERALRLLLFETLPHPKRLRALIPLLAATRKLGTERLPQRLATLAEIAPRAPIRYARKAPLAARTAPIGESRGRVGLLLGCVQRVFYPAVHRATIRALAAEGFEVLAPDAPDCCGALELHAGEEDAGIARARATIACFSALGPLDHVVVNAAGCGAAMKEYGELLGTPEAEAFSAQVSDVTELLASVAPRAPRAPLRLRAVYHDACHLAHAQGVRAQPRTLLASIPELELLEVPVEPDVCCGSAGIYNLVQPQAAAELGVRKAQHLLDTGAQAIVAGNPGCTAQLARHLNDLGHPLPIYHPIELLWRSISQAMPAEPA
ncbi:MAG: heterodisulfide reductase-related iron-sulfur binding cluster [Actinomycetota bacterium]|nr:heterodisulfide reductase-related iron-sulfur binding cluster [Actinomycetota bacterium]